MILKAGCVLVNSKDQRVALVCRNGNYSFPKGHLEDGETIIECATRETKEETGHNCHVISDSQIGILKYKNSSEKEISVYFYLAIDDGITIDKIQEEDKELTVWEFYKNIDNKLSYQILKDFWNDVKDQVEEIINEYCEKNMEDEER